MRQGLLITFEGGEGSGKTTQIKRVARWLKRYRRKIIVTREPGGTPMADRIRSILLDPKNKGMLPWIELLLYEAARLDHVDHLIRPMLKAGSIILCDRFTDATTVYQGYARRLPLPLVRSLNQLATRSLTPDLTFLLDLPAKTGLQRTLCRIGSKKESRFEREKLAFHHRIRSGYLTLARKEKRRFRIIRADREPEEVFKQITHELKKRL